jgi:hypothetical protein
MMRIDVGRAGVPARPGWAIGLEILGWLIIGLSAFTGFQYARSLYIGVELRTILPMAGSLFGFGAAIGFAMIVVGRHRSPRAQRSRLVLWARLSVLFGVTLCLGWPTMAYGLLMFIGSNDGSGQVFDVEGPVVWPLFYRALLMSALPLAIGIVTILIPLISGRRKPLPDIPAVFS